MGASFDSEGKCFRELIHFIQLTSTLEMLKKVLISQLIRLCFGVRNQRYTAQFWLLVLHFIRFQAVIRKETPEGSSLYEPRATGSRLGVEDICVHRELTSNPQAPPKATESSAASETAENQTH